MNRWEEGPERGRERQATGGNTYGVYTGRWYGLLERILAGCRPSRERPPATATPVGERGDRNPPACPGANERLHAGVRGRAGPADPACGEVVANAHRVVQAKALAVLTAAKPRPYAGTPIRSACWSPSREGCDQPSLPNGRAPVVRRLTVRHPTTDTSGGWTR